METKSDITIEQKYGPSAMFKDGMEKLATLSPDNGEKRPKWKETKAFKFLDKLGHSSLKAVTHPVTLLSVGSFVTNPIYEHQVVAQSGFLFDKVVSLNYALNSLPNGNLVLESIQRFANGPFPFGTSDLIKPENPALINLGLVMANAIHFSWFPVTAAYFGWSKVKERLRKERMNRGAEPLKKGEKPGAVMIGPAEFLSLVAQDVPPKNHVFKFPNIIVHPETGVPSAYGSKRVRYHFDISKNPHLITDPKFIKESGINSADILLLAAFDENHSVFCGRRASTKISPSLFSTLVAFLSNQKKETLAGKKILALVPEGSSLLAFTTEQHNIFTTFRAKGVDIEVFTPESVLLKEIEEDINNIASKKGKGEKIHICLVGGKDTDMLKRFEKAIKKTFKIQVLTHIISDEILDGKEVGKMNSEIREKLVEKLLKLSDINYVNGDDDAQTTDLANLMISMRGAKRERTIAILEKPLSVTDAKTFRISNICIYEKLAQETARRFGEN